MPRHQLGYIEVVPPDAAPAMRSEAVAVFGEVREGFEAYDFRARSFTPGFQATKRLKTSRS